MILKWHGRVEDSYDGMTVDGHLITTELMAVLVQLRDKVTVAIADERFQGDLDVATQLRGYSEWTPGEPESLTVGPHNLLEVLTRYEGQVVTLWISDEPVNTLEDSTQE